MKALITCNFLSIYSVKTLVFVFKNLRQPVSSLILILNGIISVSITELWSHFSPEHTKHFQNAAVLWKYNVPIDFFSSCSPGMLVRLKGSILRMAFIDSTGSQLPSAYEPWYEPNVTADGEEREKVRKRRPVSVSPSTSQDLNESQYAVVCSEKQAKVIALPSQSCIYKHSITETSFILRADVVQMNQGMCVACFCANGHIMTLR